VRALLVLIGLVLLSGCRRNERHPQADPPGMQREKGAKVSLPAIDGFSRQRYGASGADLEANGGLALVKLGERPLAIVAEVDNLPILSWSARSCSSAAEDFARDRREQVAEYEVAVLATGEACHYVTEGPALRMEIFHIAGRPTFVVACRSTLEDAEFSEQCRHAATWVRDR
jgi:hypothetical protein